MNGHIHAPLSLSMLSTTTILVDKDINELIPSMKLPINGISPVKLINSPLLLKKLKSKRLTLLINLFKGSQKAISNRQKHARRKHSINS
jgi:hypothetical protein